MKKVFSLSLLSLAMIFIFSGISFAKNENTIRKNFTENKNQKVLCFSKFGKSVYISVDKCDALKKFANEAESLSRLACQEGAKTICDKAIGLEDSAEDAYADCLKNKGGLRDFIEKMLPFIAPIIDAINGGDKSKTPTTPTTPPINPGGSKTPVSPF